MQILLAHQVIRRLKRELRSAGSREIGGLLMGEHVRDELFRIVDISIQRSGGNHSSFKRNPSEHKAQLEKFFVDTGNAYSRFNYIGEWHSHPSFEPTPSRTDLQTMQSIVEDPDVGVNFLLLLIPKLGDHKQIEATATAFRANALPVAIPLSAEPASVTRRKNGVMLWLSKTFRSQDN